ncbi:unnamed protein product [Symbiodinium sp. CCMP2592]|nr:unnamed protein product [Symbiodinium sp. CCMP2592]
MNVGNGGGSFCQPIFDKLVHEAIDMCALQEVDLNEENRLSFVKFWTSKGWHAVVPTPGAARARSAIVSRVPMKVNCGDSFFKFLFVGFYGYAGNTGDTHALLRTTCADLAPFGLPFVIAGDFQFLALEAPVSWALAQGLFYELDDCRSGRPPPTGPGNTRCIDYAVASASIRASRACTFEGTADHCGVWYDVDQWAVKPPLQPPCYPAPVRHTAPDVCAAFLSEAFTHAFACADTVEGQWEVLASYADHALTDTPLEDSRRHCDWEPRRRERVTHKAAAASEPLDVRRLRRLHRRLCHAHRHGCHASLLAVLRRNVAQMCDPFPSLGHLREGLCDFGSAASDVLEVLRAREQELRDCRLKAWKLRCKDDMSRQRQWIKQRTELCLQRDAGAVGPEVARHTAVLPQAVLEHEGPQWRRLWTAVEDQEAREHQVDALLGSLPSINVPDCSFDLSSAALRRSMRKMLGRKGGCDGFTAEQLLRLPDAWWTGFAGLWANILSQGEIPSSWKRIGVSLIPKASGGYRPIGLACLAWRCGARCLCLGLKPWSDAWAGATAFGGLPKRSVADVHRRVHHALRRGTRVAVQEDLRRFFDSIHVPLASRVLEHFGIPRVALHVFQSFYNRQQRMLTVQGCCDQQWFQASCGLIQGCPLSPLVGAAVMQVWALTVQPHGVIPLTFQDDRTLLAVRGSAEQQCSSLRGALGYSRRFDQAFALSCDPRKSSVIGSGPAEALAASLGYECCDKLSLLGVTHPFDVDCPKELARLSFERILVRLRYVGAVTGRPVQTLQHLHCLCYSPFLWAAGYAGPSKDEVHSLMEPIKSSLRAILTREAPPALFHEIFEWKTSPAFCYDRATLLAGIRMHCLRYEWHEHLPLDELAVPWHEALPCAAALLSKLQWTVTPDGGCINRIDGGGVTRSFRIGFDGEHVLREWLLLHHRRAALTKCARVNRSLRREGEGLAQGLDLPGPPAASFVRALGHRQAWKEAHDIESKRASFATGGSIWHCGKKLNLTDVSSRACTCGLLAPSRAHRTWVCPDTADLRRSIAMPLTRCQDRLMAVESCEEPPAPFAFANEELVSDTAEGLVLHDHTVVAATDGSSEANIGAYGFILHGTEVQVACGSSDEDQGSFKMELLSLEILFRVVLACRTAALLDLHVLCDCESAITALRSSPEAGGALPLLVREVAAFRNALVSQGTQVHLHWIPSHGKISARWIPWEGAHPDLQSALNDQVDKLVSRKCKSRLHGSRREAFQLMLQRHCAWEYKAVQASAEAARRLHAALMGVG